MTKLNLVALAVEQECCVGAGQCEMLEEQTFYIDDETAVAGVIGTGRLPADRAELVVDSCPAGAISIVEEPPV